MTAILKLSSPATQQFWKIPVLFEDEHLLALDKPAGLPGAPDASAPGETNLTQLLHQGIARGASWAAERKLSHLAACHRLDAEVGGVFLLAKSKAVHAAIADQFGVEKPLRTFIALICGQPREESFQVGAKVGRNAEREGAMRLDRTGRKAATLFQVAERFAGYCLMKCQPLTDQPHQIRLHLKSRGLPVVGDRFYNGPDLWLSRLKPQYRLKPGHTERPLLPALALHLEEVNFTHPVSGEPVAIQAPWPKDLKVAVKYLRLYASGGVRAAEPEGEQPPG